MKTRTWMNAVALLILVFSIVTCTQKPIVQTQETSVDTLKATIPEEAIAKLKAGNERFINGISIYPRSNM